VKSSKTIVKRVAFYKNKKVLTSLVGVFLIVLMMLSAVQLGDEDETVSYNGLEFVQANNGWQTYTNDGTRVIVSSSPSSLVNETFAAVDLSVFDRLSKVYVSVDPYDSSLGYALYDLERSFAFVSDAHTACFEDSEACMDLPLKTCDDASISTGIIVLKEANETVVTLEGTCLTVEGKNLLTLVDKLILDQYGEG